MTSDLSLSVFFHHSTKKLWKNKLQFEFTGFFYFIFFCGKMNKRKIRLEKNNENGQKLSQSNAFTYQKWSRKSMKYF